MIIMLPQIIKGASIAKKIKDALKAARLAKSAAKGGSKVPKTAPKTGTAPKGQSPYKPSPPSAGSASKNPYNKPSTTSKPKDNVTGTGSSGYNKPTAGASPKTAPTTGAKIKGAGQKALDVVAPTTGTILRKAFGAAKKVAPYIFPATGKLFKTGLKIADRATVPTAVAYGGKKLYDVMSGDDPAEAGAAEAGGSGTEDTTSQGGSTRPLPFTPFSGVNNLIVTELLKQRGKTGEGTTEGTTEGGGGDEGDAPSAIDVINEIRGKGKDESKETPKTRSRPSPYSRLSYLRTDDEVDARNRSVRERMGKEQRGRRLDAEARFRERKDFMEQSKKLKDPNLIEGPQGEVLGRVIKDSTGRIIGSSLNKAGRAAMGNRKGAGVIDGGVADAANFSGTDAQRTLAASAAMDERDAQIASMRAAQKDVADMFYSKSGGSRGSGATPAPTATAVNTGAAPKATAVNTGEPVVNWGSSSQYNRTSKSSPAPRAIPVDKGYVEGQGGYGLPAPNTTDVPNAPRAIAVDPPAPRAIPVDPPAPRAIPVNPPAPRATAVKPFTPSDVALGNQLGSMDMNPPNNPSINPPPAEVEKKPIQTGRAELPEDEGQEQPSDALFPKTPIASAVSELVKKKKKK